MSGKGIGRLSPKRGPAASRAQRRRFQGSGENKLVGSAEEARKVDGTSMESEIKVITNFPAMLLAIDSFFEDEFIPVNYLIDPSASDDTQRSFPWSALALPILGAGMILTMVTAVLLIITPGVMSSRFSPNFQVLEVNFPPGRPIIGKGGDQRLRLIIDSGAHNACRVINFI